MAERAGSTATPSGEVIAETAAAAGRQAEEAATTLRSPEENPRQPPSNSADARAGVGNSDRSDNDGAAPNSVADEDEEEEETCGFCIFMKAGGCKDTFNGWSKCIDVEREKGGDYPSDCREQTFALRECMLQNKEYYAPVLQDEVDFVADKEEEDREEAAAATG